MIKAEHHEPTLDCLLLHELRWMRTLYVLKPRSFRLIFFTFSLPLALLGLLLDAPEPYFSAVAVLLFQLTVATRLGLHFVHRVREKRPLFADLWLLPVRDLLICWVWCRSLFTSRLTWRGIDFDVGPDGIMHKMS